MEKTLEVRTNARDKLREFIEGQFNNASIFISDHLDNKTCKVTTENEALEWWIDLIDSNVNRCFICYEPNAKRDRHFGNCNLIKYESSDFSTLCNESIFKKNGRTTDNDIYDGKSYLRIHAVPSLSDDNQPWFKNKKTNFNYFLCTDSEKALWNNGIKTEIRDSKKCFVVKYADFAELTSSEIIRERLNKSSVNGHSSNFWGLDIESCARAYTRREAGLIKEIYLKDIFTRKSEMFREGKVHIRCTKGFIDAHDSDTSSIVFIGNIDVLTEYVKNLPTPQLDMVGDAANKVEILALNELLSDDPTRTICEVMSSKLECLATDCEIHFHLENLINIVIDGRRERVGLPVSDVSDLERLFTLDNLGILVAVTTYPDKPGKRILGITGGKKDIGETPLECAVREAKEEVGIDLSQTLVVREKDEDFGSIVSKNAESKIVCVFHIQKLVNCYFMLHTLNIQYQDQDQINVFRAFNDQYQDRGQRDFGGRGQRDFGGRGQRDGGGRGQRDGGGRGQRDGGGRGQRDFGRKFP